MRPVKGSESSFAFPIGRDVSLDLSLNNACEFTFCHSLEHGLLSLRPLSFLEFECYAKTTTIMIWLWVQFVECLPSLNEDLF